MGGLAVTVDLIDGRFRRAGAPVGRQDRRRTCCDAPWVQPVPPVGAAEKEESTWPSHVVGEVPAGQSRSGHGQHWSGSGFTQSRLSVSGDRGG